MRLGLIGSTGHWQTYAPALEQVAGLTLVAVAPAGPEETPGAFDHVSRHGRFEKAHVAPSRRHKRRPRRPTLAETRTGPLKCAGGGQ